MNYPCPARLQIKIPFCVSDRTLEDEVLLHAVDEYRLACLPHHGVQMAFRVWGYRRRGKAWAMQQLWLAEREYHSRVRAALAAMGK